MNKTIVFVHGAWMNPLCWEKMIGYFEAKDYKCLAPAWPYKDRSVEDLNKNPDPRLAKLGVIEIVDHYAEQIRALPEPPILIGHSFGGLFTQMLLDRGFGAAGVAIDPAPAKGIFPFYPTVFKAFSRILLTPGGWQKIFHATFKEFRYAFVHLLPEAEQKAVYDRYVVPETGRIFFQSGFAMFNNATYVNFQNPKRAPLLLTAATQDHVCPASQIRQTYQKYKRSSAPTEFIEFNHHDHWLIAEPGYEQVADYIDGWLGQLPTLS